MADNAAVDPYEILAALGITGVTAAAPVSGGQDTLIWRVERGSETVALRLFRADQHDTARREAIALRATGSVIPVPAIIAGGVWQARPVVVLEWCKGQPLLQYLFQHEEKVHSLGMEFGRMHARLHTISAPTELAPLNIVDEWLTPLDSTLAAMLRQVSRSPVLLHLDYHPMNVLTDGSHMTAVLDWANAVPGDPRLDFARTTTILRVDPWSPEPLPSHLHHLRRSFERAWRQGYLEEAGEQKHLPLFYTAAGLFMQHDLALRVARADHWLQPQHLEQVRRWTRYWRYCAGIRD